MLEKIAAGECQLTEENLEETLANWQTFVVNYDYDQLWTDAYWWAWNIAHARRWCGTFGMRVSRPGGSRTFAMSPLHRKGDRCGFYLTSRHLRRAKAAGSCAYGRFRLYDKAIQYPQFFHHCAH